jgi:hypothetical protein
MHTVFVFCFEQNKNEEITVFFFETEENLNYQKNLFEKYVQKKQSIIIDAHKTIFVLENTE